MDKFLPFISESMGEVYRGLSGNIPTDPLYLRRLAKGGTGDFVLLPEEIAAGCRVECDENDRPVVRGVSSDLRAVLDLAQQRSFHTMHGGDPL